jgi:hypothetical protein
LAEAMIDNLPDCASVSVEAKIDTKLCPSLVGEDLHSIVQFSSAR